MSNTTLVGMHAEMHLVSFATSPQAGDARIVELPSPISGAIGHVGPKADLHTLVVGRRDRINRCVSVIPLSLDVKG
jgi:hypothetical protein